MKTFYEMLRILESEQVKTPGGYTLTPEELEEYENERSPMYKALMLKDIDAKRKAEEENSPEKIAAKEAEIKRQEEEKEKQEKIEKELREAEPDFILKAFGILASAIEKSEGDCKIFLKGVEPSLKKDGNKWTFKSRSLTLGDVPVFDGKLGIPVKDMDKYYLRNITQGLVFAIEDSKEYGGCEIMLDALIKLGCKPYPRKGEIVNFDGRHHETNDSVEIYEKVHVVEPGLINSLGHLLIKAKVEKL